MSLAANKRIVCFCPFEDSLSAQIINSFFKVNDKCHYGCSQMLRIVICYALLLYFKANVEEEEYFTVFANNPVSSTQTPFFNSSVSQTSFHLFLRPEICLRSHRVGASTLKHARLSLWRACLPEAPVLRAKWVLLTSQPALLPAQAADTPCKTKQIADNWS